MKNYILMMVVAVLALEAGAKTSYGYKPSSDAMRISESGASKVKTKSAAEKQTHAKAKGIDAEKLVLPMGAKHQGMTINLEDRIESLCGFEIGAIAKLPWRPKLDKDGNIIMTGKLAKPFRKCTQYELTYSKKNHALYSIRIFSPAQKKIDDDAAWAEVKEMAAAVKTKFEGKVMSGLEMNFQMASFKSCTANMKVFAFQSLEVRADKAGIDKSTKLKGTTDARREQGWAFSLTLVDRGIYDFMPEQPKPEETVPDGIDAL